MDKGRGRGLPRPRLGPERRACLVEAIKQQLGDCSGLDNASKRFFVKAYYALHGLTPEDVAEATGFSKDFVYTTLKDLGYRCTARAVKETVLNGEKQQNKVHA